MRAEHDGLKARPDPEDIRKEFREREEKVPPPVTLQGYLAHKCKDPYPFRERARARERERSSRCERCVSCIATPALLGRKRLIREPYRGDPVGFSVVGRRLGMALTKLD